MKQILFLSALGTSMIVGASSPPTFFYINKLTTKPEVLQSLSVETICTGSAPIENNQVKVYCRLNGEDGPVAASKNSFELSYVSVFPCKHGKVNGLAKINWCGSLSEESYVEGVKNGPSKSYWSNGKARLFSQFVKGVKQGTETEYAEDGTLVQKSEFANNALHGKSYRFDPYKKVAVTRTYVNGNEVGDPVYESQYLQESLIAAAGAGDLKNVKDLILKKASPNLPGEVSSSETPMHAAAEYNKKEVLQYLLTNGGNPNVLDKFGSKTPLMAALFHSDIVQLLLEKKADPNIKGFEGRTALHLATQYSRSDVVALLLSFKANREIKNDKGKTPLDLAEALTTKDKDKIVKLLQQTLSPEKVLGDKKSTECKNKSENLPRYVEVYGENFAKEISDCPIETLHETDLNEALFAAARVGSEVAIDSLLKLGASVTATHSNWHETALLIAAREGKMAAAQILLDRGANVNAQDMHGYTPLMRAVVGGNKDLVVFFILRKASKDIKNNDGKMAVDIARQAKKTDFEKILSEP